MRKEAYKLLREAEGSWWYYGRSRAVCALLARAGVRAKRDAVLDFGAGHGAQYAELSQFGTRVYAFEPDEEARMTAETRGYEKVYDSAEETLSHRYDLIGLFDVLEHVKDDRALLHALQHALTPDGVVVITVPAYQFLWSEHDFLHQHFRRYTRHSLLALLGESGYAVMAASYWNMTLFIPAAVVRLSGYSGASVLTPPSFVDAILSFIVAIEALVLRFLPLPFGVSVVVVARREASTSDI